MTRQTPDLGALPTDAGGFDAHLVQRLIRTFHPEVEVAEVALRRVWEWGQGEAVSTSGRVDLDITYAGPDLGLPRQVVLKIARPQLPAFPLYRNEVAVYSHLRPSEFLRTPVCIGGWFDERSGTFALVLDDLSTRGATFCSALTPLTVANMESLLRQSARLHARFWGERADWSSPALSWAQSHVAGELHDLFTDPALVPAMIADEVARVQHKRELVQSVGQSPASLLEQVRVVQKHQSRLPQTLVHGDFHVGNTFVLPDGEMGPIDWQLSVRGYFMHDVSYILATGLDVETRRLHERRLIELHLDEMAAHGAVGLPTPAEAFEEYRRAQAWNVYIGWLTCPIENYGWEINVANHVRLLTAYRDLETSEAIAAIT
ncbi:aminoglycoside phosphotransferase family protein [Nocardioides sp.]|uniref:aminoglycoside phosphotransferase family protein n=1 Tax=Nocardioides sp. TaxID=35761 RepID=UPI0035646B66